MPRAFVVPAGLMILAACGENPRDSLWTTRLGPPGADAGYSLDITNLDGVGYSLGIQWQAPVGVFHQKRLSALRAGSRHSVCGVPAASRAPSVLVLMDSGGGVRDAVALPDLATSEVVPITLAIAGGFFMRRTPDAPSPHPSAN